MMSKLNPTLFQCSTSASSKSLIIFIACIMFLFKLIVYLEVLYALKYMWVKCALVLKGFLAKIKISVITI